jgi:integrase
VVTLLRPLDRERTSHRSPIRPLVLEDVVRIVAATEAGMTPPDPVPIRDRMLIMQSFLAALTPAQAEDLTFGDIQDDPAGLRLHARSLGSDAKCLGTYRLLSFGKNVAPCFACAFRRWNAVLEYASGAAASSNPAAMQYSLDFRVCQTKFERRVSSTTPLFPSFKRGGRAETRPMAADSMRTVAKARAGLAIINPDQISFGSLRLGFIASTIAAGATWLSIMVQAGETDFGLYEKLETEFGQGLAQEVPFTF